MNFKKLNYKFIIGCALLVLGVVIIGYSIDAIRQIIQAKGTIKDVENFFTHNTTWNPIVSIFGGQAEKKASSYDIEVALFLLSGIALAYVGAKMAIRNKRNKRFF